MRSIKNWVILLMMISLFFMGGCSDQKSVPEEVIRPVKALQVGNVEALKGYSFPGRAQAVHEADLAFEKSGVLNQRPVNIGDTLEKNQLIAHLDPRDFQSDLKQAQARYKNARANFQRAEELIKKNFIARTEYDRLDADMRMASATLEKARKALTDTELRAPFSGNISKLYVENFQTVQAKQKIARLVDLSRIEMIVDIPESLISLVPYVNSVNVIFDAFPDHTLSAQVKEIGKEASETTRTYPVTLIMEQPEDFKILSGMAGKASGEVSKDAPYRTVENQGIRIPVAAVFSPSADNLSYVWIIDQSANTVRKQAVTVGSLSSTGILIQSGLKVGDWVVTAGVHVLRDNQKVKILHAQES